MKIALTTDPELPVPPALYGGIERIVDLLAWEYVRRGHEVALFANAQSTCPVELIAWPGRDSRRPLDTLRNSLRLTREVLRRRFDVIHSCSRVAYLTPILALPIPKLMNYHRAVSPRTTALAHRLSRGTLEFSVVGRWMIEAAPLMGRWHVVPNCVPLSSYRATLSVPRDAPLVFLGRVEKIKGPHIAIEVARRLGRSLVIAGNVPDEHRSWYETNIVTHVDGKQIRYVGPLNDVLKNELLGQAAAFLMPTLVDEAFGLVIAEAMACGTPVIALRRGATPEVVEHGVTGFVVDTVDEMVAAVGMIDTISRAACRKSVERRFSEGAVADGYLAIYESMIARRRKSEE